MAYIGVPVAKQQRSLSTIAALIQATIDEMEAVGELGLRLESVAERAGASLGSVYHHFGDKDGLIDAARLEQFTRHADEDTAALRAALASIVDYDHLMAALPHLSAAFHTVERRARRARRLSNLAATLARPEYAQRVADVQHRVTHEIADLVEDLKRRGVIGHGADALALATFIQAYTVGRVVADVDREPLDPDRWNHTIVTALTAMLPPPEPIGRHTDAVTAAGRRRQPTAQALLDAARRQIETRTEHDFRIDEILAEVGASPSSLYHHFGSREGLMEAAWVDWARTNAEADVAAIADALEVAVDAEDAMRRIVTVVRAAQAPARAERRVQRLTVYAAAARRPAVRAEIGRLETETNERYREVLERARDRGLLAASADLAVVPVFVRAFTFGKVTNEMSATPVDHELWCALVEGVLRSLLGVPEPAVGGKTSTETMY